VRATIDDVGERWGWGGVDNNCAPRAKTWGKRGRRATMTTIMGEEVGALVFEECCMEGT
jgi:hypothetical protein